MRRMAAADIRVQHLEFLDNTSMSSMELSPSPAPHRGTPAHSGCASAVEVCLPPIDHPLTPNGLPLVNSPKLLQVPTVCFLKGHRGDNLTCPVNGGSCTAVPNGGENAVSDAVVVNEQGPPPQSVHSSPVHRQLSSLSRSLSSLSTGSARYQPQQPQRRLQHSPQLSASGQSSRFSFSSSNGFKSVFKNLLRKTGLSQENHVQAEDVISGTSGEEETMGPEDHGLTSRAIKQKLDSLAGSMYDDSEGGGSGVYKRRKRLSLRWWLKRLECKVQRKCTFKYHIDPHGTIYFLWLGVVSLAVVYSALAIPLRASYGDVVEGDGVLFMWLLFDYLFDAVYWFDFLAVQPFICVATSEGFKPAVSRRQLIQRHVSRLAFWMDMFSLLPLDILYAVPALRYNVLLRLPRVLKVRSVKMFQDRFESRTRFPNVFRVAKLVSYFLYTIHVYSCIYFSVSEKEGFGVNRWVYDGNGTSYLRCFYWAVQTMATTHNLDRGEPVTNLEYKVDLLGYIFSVFVLAVIFGEIRNIVEASNGQKMTAQRKWDRVRKYMKDWKLSRELQERVKAWYDYALSHQLNLDEAKVLDSLPKKTKADLAIHVHLDTLSKVSLFKDCEKTLLRELVLRLQPVLFVPNDFICKKGEIGKEMYIVNKGLVQVIGGPPDNSKVLAELGPGSVFGEISLLAVGGGNRRTAHVISKGFSNIFVLSKKDLNETLQEYPDARETLRKKARFLLRQDKKRENKESKTVEGESLAENVRLASKIKNNPAAKVAFMAFSTAPAKAARAQAAAAKLQEDQWEKEEKEEEENDASHHQQRPSSSTGSTVVEVHMKQEEEEKEEGKEKEHGEPKPPQRRLSYALASCSQRAKVKPSYVSRGMTYTSLWPSAKDIVITTTPADEEHAKEKVEEEPSVRRASFVLASQRAKVKPSGLTRGMTYTSLWPSAKDVFITTTPADKEHMKEKEEEGGGARGEPPVRRASYALASQEVKVKPPSLSHGLTYTSLWSSAKDIVITTMPATDKEDPNHT